MKLPVVSATQVRQTCVDASGGGALNNVGLLAVAMQPGRGGSRETARASRARRWMISK